MTTYERLNDRYPDPEGIFWALVVLAFTLLLFWPSVGNTQTPEMNRLAAIKREEKAIKASLKKRGFVVKGKKVYRLVEVKTNTNKGND